MGGEDKSSEQKGREKKGGKSRKGMEAVMECTFFKSVALESKTECVQEESSPSVRVRQGGKPAFDLDNLSQEDISTIFRNRERLNLSRLRPGLYRGLPMIRLCKPKAR